jgi:hypothetical protein
LSTPRGKSAWGSAAAQEILDNDNITLADSHVTQICDGATAQENIEDTANGHDARRSGYQANLDWDQAPGGFVALSPGMLYGLLALAAKYKFTVSELAGGQHHQASSFHYLGLAVDINWINGLHLSDNTPAVKKVVKNFTSDALFWGARRAKFEADNHMHIEWSGALDPAPDPSVGAGMNYVAEEDDA